MQNVIAPEGTRESLRNRVSWKPLRDWSAPPPRVQIALTSPAEREVIYRLRHEVYARELGQHSENVEAKLTDALDGFNQYIVASVNGEVAGLYYAAGWRELFAG